MFSVSDVWEFLRLTYTAAAPTAPNEKIVAGPGIVRVVDCLFDWEKEKKEMDDELEKKTWGFATLYIHNETAKL